MTREEAISRILGDMGLPGSYGDYVLQTMGRLGCGCEVDKDTVKALKRVIMNDMR